MAAGYNENARGVRPERDGQRHTDISVTAPVGTYDAHRRMPREGRRAPHRMQCAAARGESCNGKRSKSLESAMPMSVTLCPLGVPNCRCQPVVAHEIRGGGRTRFFATTGTMSCSTLWYTRSQGSFLLGDKVRTSKGSTSRRHGGLSSGGRRHKGRRSMRLPR